MSTKTILILSQDYDPTADRMVVELHNRGACCVRWHPDSLTSDSALALNVTDSGSTGYLKAQSKLVALEEISSVWNRQQAPLRLPEYLNKNERQFAQTEIGAALFGFLRSYKWFWVNHPDRNRYASSKSIQLQEAQQLGFDIPRTLVSNDPDAVRGFVESASGTVIYKTLHSPFFPGPEVLACFTSVVSKEHICEIGAIKHTGGIFQEYIPKQLELRITVVGNQVFAVEIHSQDIDETRVDWRGIDVRRIKHHKHRLPKEIKARCLDLTRHFGLAYAAIDMILTPEGRYVFLESNPSGQYGWIEDFTGLPLTSSLADMLLAGNELA